MAVLINGNGYSPVTAQQDADLYAGIIGNATTILGVGEKMAATIIDANTIRVADGEMVSQGRRIHIDAGEYDDFTIPTGAANTTRYYIIGYRLYSDSNGNELAEKFVRQVASATTVIQEASLRDGAAESYVSLYRVQQDGFTISNVSAIARTNGVLGIIDMIYPVGAIYMSVNSANPRAFLGGTWVAWGTGRVPVGIDTSQTEFNAVEKQGGEKKHLLSVNEIPSHQHQYYIANTTAKYAQGSVSSPIGLAETQLVNTVATGGGQDHNNLQPYITCYMWKRTA